MSAKRIIIFRIFRYHRVRLRKFIRIRFCWNPKISTNLRITYYRRGQCLSPRTVPALCDGVV